MPRIKGILICCLLGWALNGWAADETAGRAAECTRITSRLERLSCFDSLFGTPIRPTAAVEVVSTQGHPVEYQAAQASEMRRDVERQEMRFIPGHDAGEQHRLWLTAPAIGALPPRPLLMLSCIDDISRVELVLPQALDVGWIQVGVEGAGRQLISQRWVSDDSGYILRSGRGLPAIEAMKAMLRAGELRLSAGNEALDGLQFDTMGLKEQVAPLRQMCGW